MSFIDEIVENTNNNVISSNDTAVADDDSCHKIANIGGKNRLLLAKTSAWHGLGTVANLDEIKTVDDLKREFPWIFAKYSHSEAVCMAGDEPVTLKGVLGLLCQFPDMEKPVVLGGFPADKERPIIQPEQHIEMLIEAFREFGSEISSMGYLFGGKRFFASAEMARFDVAGDEVCQFVNLLDGYYGDQAYCLTGNDFRQVCLNTVKLAHKNGKRMIRLKHTKNMKTDLKKLVKELTGWKAGFESIQETMKEFPKVKTDVSDFVGTILDRVSSKLNVAKSTDSVKNLELDDFETVEAYADAVKKTDKGIKRRKSVIDEILNNYESPTCETERGSVWSAYNAVTEYGTHGYRTNSGDYQADREIIKTIDPSVIGNRGDVIQQAALEYAVELVSA